jgi:formylglycine-generating enzyme required for sulfatase activity
MTLRFGKGRSLAVLSILVGVTGAFGFLACSDDAVEETPTPAADGGGAKDSASDAKVNPTKDGGADVIVAADGGGTDDASDGSAAVKPPSCQGTGKGIDSCGPNGTGDCCESASLVTSPQWNRRNDPNFPAKVAAYKLDKYEVTVGRFRKFVAANQGTKATTPKPAAKAGALPGDNGPNAGWDPAFEANLTADKAAFEAALAAHPDNPERCTYAKNDDELPINNITFYEAMLFCAWDGGFVPSEAMWLYAAEGGTENRKYPWTANPADGGAAPKPVPGDGAFCEVGTGTNPGDWVCTKTTTSPSGTVLPSPVYKGGLPSKDGLFHLTGNVNEVFQDWTGRPVQTQADGGTLTLPAPPMFTPCDGTASGQVNGCPRSDKRHPQDTTLNLDRRVSAGGSFDYPDTFTMPDGDGGVIVTVPDLMTTRTRIARVNPSFRSPTQGIRCARAAQ